MSLWFFGWVGTVFLTASRVIFATAFDRILPEWAARVDRSGTPYFAILIMLGPSLVISYFYAYNSNVHELDARRDARDRGDVPRLDGRGGDPAVAEARDLQRVADREVQGARASR